MGDTNFPVMLTIKRASELFSLPEYFIRQLIKKKKLPYVTAGVKILINQALLIEYLNGSDDG